MEDEIRMSAQVRFKSASRSSGGAAALLLAALLAGCGTATVVKPSGSGASGGGTTPRTSVPKPGQTAVVRRGDTLYALARIHNITPGDLAAWNGLSNPNAIYPGQTLRLYPGGATAATRPATGGSTATRPATPPAAATPPPVNSGIGWRWPADGSLVGRFVAGETTKQGIDIAGNSGQAVRAAGPGVVVYSGAGLVGYGELIIIKHNDQWLSAYGHNRKRLVNEGQSVKTGDQIAEMGRTGTSRDMLHFEIRYNGKPVDPLQYLPAR
ncbi:peptidoglycan DD-metalloendopeptidase family protein [Stenotrophomonas mori]|uniref:Peptidoglycan DD-metalloendopeptidase family protein n=1 Tax=Stenotrophomonas mori TaxID=2871096 RepID=A0ABT0SFP9_9GAMM|nr:peptidoglycan DD-metalloendopeptidase family protein [Stenotrophomonas mori]MCL7714151.1 peptidoglycan DD-metalloendopeptidase family protein [Stenotrophomonas mori]